MRNAVASSDLYALVETHIQKGAMLKDMILKVQQIISQSGVTSSFNDHVVLCWAGNDLTRRTGKPAEIPPETWEQTIF